MRFLARLSRRHQGRLSAPSKKEPGTGKRRFRRGTSASLLHRRRAAISTILAALMLVVNIPATAAGTVTSTIPVGLNPQGVAFTPDGSTAYVTNAGSNTVSVIDAASGTVTSTIPVGTQPRGVAFTPDGAKAYVTNWNSNTVSVIDAASGTVTSTIPVGSGPFGVAFTPDGSTAYVTNYFSDRVSVVTVASGTVTSTIPAGSGPAAVAFTPDGSKAYVTNWLSNRVSVVTVASGTVSTSTIPVGTQPGGVAFTPDGSKAYVTNWNSKTVSVIDVATGTVTSTISVGTQPRGVAFTPDGSTAYVANDGSNTVSVVTVASGTVTSTIPVLSVPFGVAFTPDGSTAYVTNAGFSRVSVITVNPAAPVFTADTPPATGTVGSAYSYAFTATGNPAPQFTVSSGSLPAGLTLDPATGVLSGTPTTAGESTFTITAANRISPNAVTDPITITIAPAAPTDTTDPTISIASPTEGSETVQGAALNAAYTCADESGGSGLASCVGTVANGAALDTSVVGEKSFTVTATDNAGNTATTTVSYLVVWPFGGFTGSVDPLPTLNSTKAGGVVPVRFSLGGDLGLDILAPGSPTSAQIGCDPSAPVDLIEETASSPGANTLSYDTATGQYAYNWKTNKAWKNTCRQLTFKLADDASYRANFRFS